MGKCLLAFSPAMEAAVHSLPALTPVTPRTITHPAALRHELEAVRGRGWALNDEERNRGVRAVAVPVLDSTGVAIAAIAVQGPTIRVTDDRLEGLAADIAATARRIAPLLIATTA